MVTAVTRNRAASSSTVARSCPSSSSRMRRRRSSTSSRTARDFVWVATRRLYPSSSSGASEPDSHTKAHDPRRGELFVAADVVLRIRTGQDVGDAVAGHVVDQQVGQVEERRILMHAELRMIQDVLER